MRCKMMIGGALLALWLSGGVAAWGGGACEPGWVDGVGAPGSSGSIRAMAVHNDGSGQALYAGGTFSGEVAIPGNNIARWDGSVWSALGGGLNGSAFAVAAFDEGMGPVLFAGGNFSQADGMPASRIARWDGVSWSPLGSGMPAGIVNALAVFDDGSGEALYAAGFFPQAGGVTVNGVARWDGVSWSALGAGVNGIARALAVFDDGSGSALYVGGQITAAGGIPVNNIARWDGSSWSVVGSGMNGSVSALTAFDDGSGPALYAGGQFESAGGVVNNIARWDGVEWSAVGGGTDGPVIAMGVYNDGSGEGLYAGGSFTTAGGIPASSIARWDGAAWSALGAGTNGSVLALQVFDDGDGLSLYAGGLFGSAGGLPAGGIAEWRGCVLAPAFVEQPESVLLPPSGGLATLSVVADGFELTYQWSRDGVPLSDGGSVSGATTPELTVFSSGPSMTGLYTCEVTDAFGVSVLSKPAVLATRPSCAGDVDFNGVVDADDLGILLGAFGAVCP